jgi:hypothetical protein
MNRILDWMRHYNTEITWFIIGILLQSGLTNLAAGNWERALFEFSIAILNFLLYKKA